MCAYRELPYIHSILFITEVLEEGNAASDPEVIKKARHYYQGCIDEGQFTSYVHLCIWLIEKVIYSYILCVDEGENTMSSILYSI